MVVSDRNASIRPAKPTDAVSVACLHVKGIETGFLSLLGNPLLVPLYEAMMRFDSAVLLVAVDPQNDVMGFVSGTVDVRAFYRDFLFSRYSLKAAHRLLRHKMNSRVSSAASNVSNGSQISLPKKFIRICETLTYPIRSRKTPLPRAELLSIVVNPKQRGTGVSAQLMVGLQDYFRLVGVEEFKVVVAADNLRARRYYEKMEGSLRTEIEVHAGEPSCVYCIHL